MNITLKFLEKEGVKIVYRGNNVGRYIAEVAFKYPGTTKRFVRKIFFRHRPTPNEIKRRCQLVPTTKITRIRLYALSVRVLREPLLTR